MDCLGNFSKFSFCRKKLTLLIIGHNEQIWSLCGFLSFRRRHLLLLFCFILFCSCSFVASILIFFISYLFIYLFNVSVCLFKSRYYQLAVLFLVLSPFLSFSIFCVRSLNWLLDSFQPHHKVHAYTKDILIFLFALSLNVCLLFYRHLFPSLFAPHFSFLKNTNSNPKNSTVFLSSVWFEKIPSWNTISNWTFK